MAGEHGTLARFATADELLRGVRSAREAGYQAVDAYAPFPVPDLAGALGFSERRIPVVSLVAGVVCGIAALAMQWYAAVWSYPFVVGGKPLASWPAFMVVTFEVGVLAAVLTAVLAMLAGNRLPRPHHPVFDWTAFDRASCDSFFLWIAGGDRAARHRLLETLDAAEIRELDSC